MITRDDNKFTRYCTFGLEDKANEQINNVCALSPTKAVSVMPDCHPGYGMPIGCVAALDGCVSPNMVGKDIGCGMRAVRTTVRVRDISPEFYPLFFNLVKAQIPVGFNTHVSQDYYPNDLDLRSASYSQFYASLTEDNIDRIRKSLGTLGGGNHFIELQKDEDGYLWIMLHSGSRKLGELIANHFHAKALEMNKKWHTCLSNDELAFLPVDSKLGRAYLQYMNLALSYAYHSRLRMMNTLEQLLDKSLGGINTITNDIDIHHNYVALENVYGKDLWLHRKGATSAKKDELGIIPGSMATKSYIVRGKGNIQSMNSCSHGAGRPRSRTDSSNILDEKTCIKEMEEIYFEGFKPITRGRLKGQPDLSEAGGAYKDINEVMEQQKELVYIITELTPLGVLKG